MPPLLTAQAADQLLMAGADGALFSHTALLASEKWQNDLKSERLGHYDRICVISYCSTKL